VKYVDVDGEVEPLAQTIPTGISRTFATANKALDIDGVDDVRINADIAVIDSGVDQTHPDLNVVARTDCSNGTEKEAKCVDSSGTDTSGHGTGVAGIAAAIDNSFGVVGTAPGARIWAVKVTGTGTNYFSELIAGIEWVTTKRNDENTENDIEVANISLGCVVNPLCPTKALDEAITKSVEEGVVHVVAAGNGKEDAKNWTPANSPDVITVSALADSDGLAGGKGSSSCTDDLPVHQVWSLTDDTFAASFSNYGATVEIAAPGNCILSTFPGSQYKKASGTSEAAPYVAGAAAVLAAQEEPESKKQVEAIRETLQGAGNTGWTDTSPDGIKERVLDLSALSLPPTCDPLSKSRIKIADMNGDSKADIFRFTDPADEVGEGRVWISEGKSYTPETGKQAGTGFGIAYEDRTGDWDGDGDDDIFQFTESGRVDGWLSEGTKYKQLSQIGTGFAHPCQTRLGDMNGDGKDDIFRFTNQGNGYAWLSTGDPKKYEYKGLVGTGFGHSDEVRVGDMDGDGDADLFQFTSEGNGYAWRSNKSSYTYLGLFATGFGNAAQVRVGDRDADGDDDLYQFTDEGKGYFWESKAGIYTYLGNFTSGFGLSRQVRIADINGDKKSDILWFKIENGNGYAWLGDGKGGFESLGQIGTGFGAP